ncbi:MAG: hypothetical protein ABI811_16870 [Acidobacteriota bacterium]
MRTAKGMLCVLGWCAVAFAQQSPEMREVLDRLAKLEEQNRQLTSEIQALKAKLAPAAAADASAAAAVDAAPLVERVEVAERRIAELDQTRVASDNRLPVTLTGMLLFNAFANGRDSGGAQYPLVLPAAGRAVGAGGTFRQSVLGLKLDGPTVLGGAKVNGAVFMDFFSGGTGLNQTMRLRIATLDLAWKNTTVGFAFDKPIMAPREPDSLAQVGISPLTGSGNLWLWQPQFRVEHRRSLGDRAGVRAQAGVYQTAEGGAGVSSAYADSLAASRPGYQGRFEFWTQKGSRRFEIAPGFHASSTRVVGDSVASRIFSVDWLLRPLSRVEFTGTYFHGRNTGVIGGLRQGVSIFSSAKEYDARAVHAIGGWAQVKIIASQRTTFHFFGGQQDDRNRDLLRDGVAKNQSYGANVMYRWGSNILTSFEASQVRTTYFGSGTRMNPHYDLAIAYLF